MINPLEKEIEKAVVSYAKLQGFLAYKFVSPANRGVPDRLFISPKGFVFFIEFKRQGRPLTDLQDHVITQMRNKKAEVIIIDNVESGKRIIDTILQDAL